MRCKAIAIATARVLVVATAIGGVIVVVLNLSMDHSRSLMRASGTVIDDLVDFYADSGNWPRSWEELDEAAPHGTINGELRRYFEVRWASDDWSLPELLERCSLHEGPPRLRIDGSEVREEHWLLRLPGGWPERQDEWAQSFNEMMFTQLRSEYALRRDLILNEAVYIPSREEAREQ